MIKDSLDPYVMAYKLGTIDEFYDISSGGFLSYFLQVLLFFVAVN